MDVKYPFGAALFNTVASAATIALDVENSLQHTTIALEEAATINVTPAAGLEPGAILVLKVSSDGTARDLTLGTGITGPALSGVINKTKVVSFIYDGSNFVQMAAAVQID